MEDYGAEEYVVIERGGVKIAVFGLFGKEADDYAPESGTYLRDPVEAAKDVDVYKRQAQWLLSWSLR